MKITDYKNFIKTFPYKEQAFRIKRQNWIKPEKENQYSTDIEKILEKIFNANSNIIEISRYDLYDEKDTKKFILKTLMWGYPTKGRGNNINKILSENQFNSLCSEIENLRKKGNISISDLKKLNNIKGLGLSTITKFTNFLNLNINGNKTVILDKRILTIIENKIFEEFNKIEAKNAFNKYEEYINIINDLSKKMKAHPEQIELFLYSFGNNLKRKK